MIFEWLGVDLVNNFLEQLLQLSIPQLARAVVDSIYIAIALLSIFILIITLSYRESKKRTVEHKTWVKLKADNYQRFHEIENEFEKLVSDFEYFTLKVRSQNTEGLESVMLQQLQDKSAEIHNIVDRLQKAKYPNDRELFLETFYSTNRYISHVERVIKHTREYLNNNYRLEDAINGN